MAKFKNKKNNQIVEENLNFYIEQLRNNPNFKEVKEKASDKNKEVEKKATSVGGGLNDTLC